MLIVGPQRTNPHQGLKAPERLLHRAAKWGRMLGKEPRRKRPIDYFRMFCGDTALFGPAHAVENSATWRSSSAEHVQFGTDLRSPEGEPKFVRDTIRAVNAIDGSFQRWLGYTAATCG